LTPAAPNQLWDGRPLVHSDSRHKATVLSFCSRPLAARIESSRHVFARARAALRSLCILAFAGFVILLSEPLHGQSSANVSVVANEQLFAVLAAMNAAGYDTGLGSEPPSSPRLEARAWCARRNPPVLPLLKRYYEGHAYADPSADLGQFISLALMLGPAPDFKPTVADTDLPPDAQAIKDLVPLVQRFYREADLQELWTRFQPAYETAIESLSDPMRRTIVATDAYLGFAGGAYLGRNYTINLSLLGAPGQVQARVYGANYYVVLTRSTESRIADLRHQYLHFLLDPLAVKYAFDIHQKQPLAALARPAPALGTDFKEDFPLLLTECLIRAVELRLDKSPRAQEQIGEFTLQGLILVPYFYEALATFTKQAVSMNVFYQPMIAGILIAKERQRLAKVQFSAAAPAREPVSHPAPPPSPEQAMLDQGDNLIYGGKYPEAKAVFESVLATNVKSERALFGLAVVASNTRKPDTAEDYFKKTLEAGRSLRIVSWSHIYLGRLYDVEGHRKEAIDQYRAGAVTAGAFPDAVRAAQNGLAQPFGIKPQDER
jgi:tetratricopeptide (TPR) repeat protein